MMTKVKQTKRTGALPRLPEEETGLLDTLVESEAAKTLKFKKATMLRLCVSIAAPILAKRLPLMAAALTQEG